MIEIRTILAPTDFSPHAEKAVRYACGLAERLGAELHLLHVLSEIVPAGPDPMLAPVLPPEYYAETEAAVARDARRRCSTRRGARPTSVETAVRWGSPVEAIVDYAAEHAIDLIVIATHGRTGLSHVLLGSVAERIVREAPCPVLTIRDRERVGRPSRGVPMSGPTSAARAPGHLPGPEDRPGLAAGPAGRRDDRASARSSSTAGRSPWCRWSTPTTSASSRTTATPSGKTLLEVPAGTIDPGERPTQTAARELTEETGYRAGRIARLAEWCVSPGVITERMYLYLCEDLTPGPDRPPARRAARAGRRPLGRGRGDGPRRPDRGRQDDAGDPALRPPTRERPGDDQAVPIEPDPRRAACTGFGPCRATSATRLSHAIRSTRTGGDAPDERPATEPPRIPPGRRRRGRGRDPRRGRRRRPEPAPRDERRAASRSARWARPARWSASSASAATPAPTPRSSPRRRASG